jgi:hypothetical protein
VANDRPTEINLFFVAEHCQLHCVGDLGVRVMAVDVFGLSVKCEQQFAKAEIRLSDFVVEDPLNRNPFFEKVMLHVGQQRVSNNLLDDLSVSVSRKDYQGFIEEGLQSPLCPPQHDRSLLEQSLFKIKSNLIDFFSWKMPKLNSPLPELPPASVVVQLDLTAQTTSVEVERVLVVWDSEFVRSMQLFFGEWKSACLPKLKEVLRKEGVGGQRDSRRTSETSQKEPANPFRKRKTHLSDRSPHQDGRRSGLAPSEGKPTDSPQPQLKVSIKLFQFLNFNKSFFQTEFRLDQLHCTLTHQHNDRHFELWARCLQVNDLTGYPFTKQVYELRNPATLKRQPMVQLGASAGHSDDSDVPDCDPVVKALLGQNSLVVKCELLSEESAAKSADRVKNTAVVYVRSVVVNYFQQLTFRLIDLINLSVMPLVMPDEFPSEKSQLWTRMTQFFRTSYKVHLFDSTVVLKPNPLFTRHIKLRVSQTTIANRVQRDTNRRDLSGANREFFTETIVIELAKSFWEGHSAPKESVLFSELAISFTRFLFPVEVRSFYGKDDFFKTVFFGNEVVVKCSSLHLSLSRNDFLLLMSVLFGNINFDDLRSTDYSLVQPSTDSYVNPMHLTVDFQQLFVYFRYDKQEEKPKVFAVVALPGFKVKFAKSLNNTKDIRITAQFLKASAFEVTTTQKDNLMTVDFVEPISQTANQESDDFGISFIRKGKTKDSKSEKYGGNSSDGNQHSSIGQNNKGQETNDQHQHQQHPQHQQHQHQQHPQQQQQQQQQQHQHPQHQQHPQQHQHQQQQQHDSFFSQLFSHPPLHTSSFPHQPPPLFIMTVRTDSTGSDTAIELKHHKLLLINSVFGKLIQFTQMVDEMGINMMMQPLIESVPSNIKFQLTLTSTIISLPSDPHKFPQPVSMFIGHCRTTYNRLVKKYSAQMAAKLSFFQTVPESVDRTLADHALSMFQNAYNLEKLSLFETESSVMLDKVHVFVAQNDLPQLFVPLFETNTCQPDFDRSLFTASDPVSRSNIRFIAFDLSLEYATETLFSNSYKSLSLTKGTLSNRNFLFALATADFALLTELNSSLTKFGFDSLVLDDCFLSEARDILAANTRMNDNEYSFSKKTEPTKQRKHLLVHKLQAKLLVLDDVFGTLTPMVEVRVLVEPTVLLKTHFLDDFFKTRIGIDVSVFNGGLRVWEPLLENVSLSVSRSWAERIGRQSLAVQSMNNLACLNVSAEALDLFMCLRQNVRAVKEGSGQPQDFVQSPFSIHNKTGRIMEVVVRASEGNTFRTVLQDNQSHKVADFRCSNKQKGKVGMSVELFIAELNEEVRMKDFGKGLGTQRQNYMVNGHMVKSGDSREENSVDDYFSCVFSNPSASKSSNENNTRTNTNTHPPTQHPQPQHNNINTQQHQYQHQHQHQHHTTSTTQQHQHQQHTQQHQHQHQHQQPTTPTTTTPTPTTTPISMLLKTSPNDYPNRSSSTPTTLLLSSKQLLTKSTTTSSSRASTTLISCTTSVLLVAFPTNRNSLSSSNSPRTTLSSTECSPTTRQSTFLLNSAKPKCALPSSSACQSILRFHTRSI